LQLLIFFSDLFFVFQKYFFILFPLLLILFLNIFSPQDRILMSEKLRHLFTIETLPHLIVATDDSTSRVDDDDDDNLSPVSIPRVDVLLFVAPELDPTAHYLGHSRLAPVQIGVSAGSGTSGLGGIVGHLDYFVTGDALHREDAHRSYTEQMVRLPHSGAMLPTKVAGLPESVKVGSPLQYMFKYRYQQSTLYLYARHQYVVVLHDEMEQIHEKFDEVLARLLWDHEELHVLFVGTFLFLLFLLSTFLLFFVSCFLLCFFSSFLLFFFLLCT
jgi:hypothetical protein